MDSAVFNVTRAREYLGQQSRYLLHLPSSPQTAALLNAPPNDLNISPLLHPSLAGLPRHTCKSAGSTRCATKRSSTPTVWSRTACPPSSTCECTGTYSISQLIPSATHTATPAQSTASTSTSPVQRLRGSTMRISMTAFSGFCVVVCSACQGGAGWGWRCASSGMRCVGLRLSISEQHDGAAAHD